MKNILQISFVLCTLTACSGVMSFVYYEPHADGWKLRHISSSVPDDEIIYRNGDNAVAVSAMTLNTNLKSVGPAFLPIVPVNGRNEQANSHEPGALNISMIFFLREPATVDFSRITLAYDDIEIPVHAVYRLPTSTLQVKEIAGMSETVPSATEYARTHGQFPNYQLTFPWEGDKPDEFDVNIPLNAIRISGESIPATIIHFKKKTASKYQYFP